MAVNEYRIIVKIDYCWTDYTWDWEVWHRDPDSRVETKVATGWGTWRWSARRAARKAARDHAKNGPRTAKSDNLDEIYTF